MEQNEIISYLREKDLLETDQVIVTRLSGGVSSDIHLVTDGEKSFVLKRALPKLRVEDDWFAGMSRNHFEQEYMKYVGAFLPKAAPRILYSDAKKGLFIMEYLSVGYVNWKELLLAKRVESTPALEAARILGTIHNHAWGDTDARAKFNSTQNFLELRIEPYLLATAKKHPDLSTTT